MTEDDDGLKGDAKVINFRLKVLDKAVTDQEIVSKDNNTRLIKLEADVKHLEKTMTDRMDGIHKILVWLFMAVAGGLITAATNFVVRGGLKL